MSHIINKHSRLSDPLFNNCFHGVIQPRKWLKAGMYWDWLNFCKGSPLIRINDALGHSSPENSLMKVNILCCNVIWELARLIPNALTFLYVLLFEMQVHKHMKSYVVCWTTLIWWRESNRLLHLHKQVAWRDSIQFWIILLQKWLPFPMLECTAGIIILSFPSQCPILWWIFGIFVVGSTHRYIVEIIISLCIAHFILSYTNSS